MDYLNNIIGYAKPFGNDSGVSVSNTASGSRSDQQVAINKNTLQWFALELVDIAKESYQLEFSKAPLTKNIVTILGDQSAGKSSFVSIAISSMLIQQINYLFSSLGIRETGAQSIDTQFTIIECLSEYEFMTMVGEGKYRSSINDMYKKQQNDPTFDYDEWLTAPLERMDTDSRKNLVYFELKQTQKINRYRQFYESSMRSVFLKHHELVKAVVINERFIKGTDFEYAEWNKKQNKTSTKYKKKTEHLNDFIDNIFSNLPTTVPSQERKEVDDVDWQVIHPNLMDNKGIVYDHFSKSHHNMEKTQEEDSERWLVKDLIFIDTPGFK